MIKINVHIPETGIIKLPANLDNIARTIAAQAHISIRRANSVIYDEPVDGRHIFVSTDNPEISEFAVRWNLAGLTVAELQRMATELGAVDAETESKYGTCAEMCPLVDPFSLLDHAATGYPPLYVLTA